MSSYQDFTQQVGDQWVAAVMRAEEAYTKSVAAIIEAKPDLRLPKLVVPQQLADLGESLTSRVPKAAEIIEANYEFTQRLLTAHRDLALSLLAAADQSEKSEKSETVQKSAESAGSTTSE